MKKKHAIIRTACRLFAEQGYDGTSTLQIATEAGATEPLIFYHFKGKDDLFTSILTPVFDRLFEKLDALGKEPPGPFETIERIIAIHFETLEEMPQELAVAIRACPAKLKTTAHICAEYTIGWRDRLKRLFTDCLEKGVAAGEFRDMPIPEIVNILIAFVNGLVRQQVYKMDDVSGARAAAVSFCRWSLVKNQDVSKGYG